MKLPSPFKPLARRIATFGKRRVAGSRLPLQTGALPYRLGADGEPEILLVTSRGGGRWIVPKGWPMADRTLAEAAALEAFEEAGVHGDAGETELGRFEHVKSDPLAGPILCEIALFPLRVEEELAEWPERGQRERRWFAPQAAAEAVQSERLRALLLDFAKASRAAGPGPGPAEA